ncbi:MAG: DUF4245 domain-containing protein [Mycobacterium leprae]
MAGRARGFETVGDMVRSMGLVVAAAAVLVFLGSRPNPEAVKVVDYQRQVQAAERVAPYDVLAPHGLPPRWRATSARLRVSDDQRVADLRIGFVTPSDAYAALKESNAPAAAFVARETKQGLVDGTLAVAGRTWEKRHREAGDGRSLVLRTADVTVVVTGTASYDELTRLAASLR